MAKKNSKPRKRDPRTMSLPVTPVAHVLAQEVMALGRYGTLTNTVIVSLENEKGRLTKAAQS